MGNFERLSFLDNSFLALETRTTHMHVVGVSVFDAGPATRDDGGIDIDKIRTFFDSRLRYIPRYRQRLAFTPFERHPVWIDDEHFDLDYHIRHLSLPHPGSDEQLNEAVGQIISQQLDRARPLWELWVIEGLTDGRFATLSKVHHCMIDGMAGVELMSVAFNFVPSDEIENPKPWQPRKAPDQLELLTDQTARRVANQVRRARRMLDWRTSVPETVRSLREKVGPVRSSLESGWLSQASETPINGVLSPTRRFETLVTPLDDVKAIKNALGGSVNDVVLAVVAGAVRKYLVDHRSFDVTDIEFRSMAPVSVRSQDKQKAMGNQVAMWLVTMPIDEADPVARLEATKAETTKLKETNQALGAATLVQASSGAPATVVSLATRLASGIRPFNMTVTNVPGPQFPLYLLDSKLLAQYALVPLWESHGLGVALFSYDGKIYWGLNSDWDLVPDLDVVVRCIQDSLEELTKAAEDALQASSASETLDGAEGMPAGEGADSTEESSGEADADSNPAGDAATDDTSQQQQQQQGGSSKKRNESAKNVEG